MPLPGKINRLYDSFLGKNLKNSQKTKLIKKFEFSTESWLGEHIVNLFNGKMKAWEEQNEINRLQPGQLLTIFKNQEIVLTLLNLKWIKKLTNGHFWSQIRTQIENYNLTILKKIEPKATIRDVRHLINQRSLLPKVDDFRWENFEFPEKLGNPDIHKKYLKRTEEEPELPLEISHELLDCLIKEKISRHKAQAILETLAKERVKFCPLKSDLKVGQVVWIGMDVSTFSPFRIKTDRRHQIPLIISLYTPDEIKEARNINSLDHLTKFNLKRLERVCFQAYHQGAVLSVSDLNLMFFLSRVTISNLSRKYIKNTEVILPTPGTKMDFGKAISHKKIIIDKHLEGKLNLEIQSATNHDEESIDRYLNTFQSVLILYVYKVPRYLMSKILKTGSTIIEEYIDIIESYFENKEKMLGYLKKQGVKIP